MTTDQQKLEELVEIYKPQGGINKILPKDTMFLHGCLMVFTGPEVRGMDWIPLPTHIALTLVEKAAEDTLRGKGWGYYEHPNKGVEWIHPDIVTNRTKGYPFLTLADALRAEMERKSNDT